MQLDMVLTTKEAIEFRDLHADLLEIYPPRKDSAAIPTPERASVPLLEQMPMMPEPAVQAGTVLGGAEPQVGRLSLQVERGPTVDLLRGKAWEEVVEEGLGKVEADGARIVEATQPAIEDLAKQLPAVKPEMAGESTNRNYIPIETLFSGISNPAGNAGATCHHFAQAVESALPELFECPIVGWKRWFILRGIRWFVEKKDSRHFAHLLCDPKDLQVLCKDCHEKLGRMG